MYARIFVSLVCLFVLWGCSDFSECSSGVTLGGVYKPPQEPPQKSNYDSSAGILYQLGSINPRTTPAPIAGGLYSFSVTVHARVDFERTLCCVKALSPEDARAKALLKLGDDDPTVEPFWVRSDEDIEYTATATANGP